MGGIYSINRLYKEEEKKKKKRAYEFINSINFYVFYYPYTYDLDTNNSLR